MIYILIEKIHAFDIGGRPEVIIQAYTADEAVAKKWEGKVCNGVTYSYKAIPNINDLK